MIRPIRTSIGPVGCSQLIEFCYKELMAHHNDEDRDVVFMNRTLFEEMRTCGFYAQGKLVGFARWDHPPYHLASLYVTPAFRGLGIASDFFKRYRIETLKVMPTNHLAIRLYERLGFYLESTEPTRLFMRRRAQTAA